MRIVYAVSTPFQVNFFEQLVRRRSDDEYIFAARDRDATISMLKQKGLKHVNVGGYDGRDLDLKLKEFAQSLLAIGGILEEFKPEIVLTERYPPAVHAAYLLGLPCWTIFNDEREYHVNHLTHPLASRVFVPSFYDWDILKSQGVVDEEKVTWVNGFVTCYLKGIPRDSSNPFLGVRGFVEGRPVVLVRPEFEFSVFFQGYKPVLEKVVRELLLDLDANVIVLPRTSAQRARYKEIGALVPDSPLPGSLVAHADVVLGCAETMLCEAFTLGVPAVSCVYWNLTRPMQLLHKYIPHSTDPKRVAALAKGFVEDQATVAEYRRVSGQVIGSMENPIDVIESLILG